MLVAVLNFKFVKIYGSLMYSGRSSRFKPADSHSRLFQTVGKICGRQYGIRSAGIRNRSNVNCSVKICSAGNYDRLAKILCSKLCLYSANGFSVVLKKNFCDLGLLEIKILSFLNSLLHKVVICYPVYLRSQAVNGRSFSFVKNSALY